MSNRTHDIRLSENQIRVIMQALGKLGPMSPAMVRLVVSGVKRDHDEESFTPQNLQDLFKRTLAVSDADYAKDTLNSFVL